MFFLDSASLPMPAERLRPAAGPVLRALESLAETDQPSRADFFLHLMEAQGAATHGYVRTLAIAYHVPHRAALVDAVHLLNILHHGRPVFAHLIDQVITRLHGSYTCPQALAQWQQQATRALEEDRHWLMHLMRQFGPSAYMSKTLLGVDKLQHMRRHVVTILQSERRVCALGAMLCLAQQCDILRIALNNSFAATALAHPADGTPALRSCTHKLVLALIEPHMPCPKAARALAFGVDQMALLFTRLLDVLEARQAHSLP